MMETLNQKIVEEMMRQLKVKANEEEIFENKFKKCFGNEWKDSEIWIKVTYMMFYILELKFSNKFQRLKKRSDKKFPDMEKRFDKKFSSP
jgi:hypothetical protein